MIWEEISRQTHVPSHFPKALKLEIIIIDGCGRDADFVLHGDHEPTGPPLFWRLLFVLICTRPACKLKGADANLLMIIFFAFWLLVWIVSATTCTLTSVVCSWTKFFWLWYINNFPHLYARPRTHTLLSFHTFENDQNHLSELPTGDLFH